MSVTTWPKRRPAFAKATAWHAGERVGGLLRVGSRVGPPQAPQASRISRFQPFLRAQTSAYRRTGVAQKSFQGFNSCDSRIAIAGWTFGACSNRLLKRGLAHEFACLAGSLWLIDNRTPAVPLSHHNKIEYLDLTEGGTYYIPVRVYRK